MKHFKITGTVIAMALVLFLSSCGGSGTEKTATVDSAAMDTTAKMPPAPVSTIDTTQTNLVVVTQKVKNYEKWKMVYDGHDTARLASGVHNYIIARGMMDSNMVLVALKIDDTAKAKAFAKSPGLKAAMQKGGIIGMPGISFVTETWQDTAMIDTKIRSRSMFTVKDWGTWLTAFNASKQERMDNGIVARVIGHDLNNSNKVSIVTAITDTAKAFAYYKSDAIKKRRMEAGVIGEPVRFLFRVVQHYE